MGSSLQTVIDSATRRVVPGPGERGAMAKLSSRLREKVEKILSSGDIKANVSVQGSVARDTWLSREADLDIFARFPPDVERAEWTRRVLPTLRRGLSQYRIIERYAEHPFLEFHVDRITVNVVPCYAVEKGKWKSATDRTPFHTEYMRSKLTPELRVEARLLKRFMKGIGVYGAEIRVGGFSGMLAETLTLNYKSLVDTLKGASRWTGSVLIDIEDSQNTQGRPENRNFNSPFVVVDPVDPYRNLAAAVREENLWSFVAAGREFMRTPTPAFFYPPNPSKPAKALLANQLKKSGLNLVAILFTHPPMVLDVLWGQLLRLERGVVSLMERYEFRVVTSRVWSNDKRLSAILLQVERASLPPVQLHRGPPVWRVEEGNAFLDRYSGAKDTVRGPWLTSGRWIVERRREFSSTTELVKGATRDRGLGFSVPRQLEAGFRNAKVLLNRDVLSLCSEEGFPETLWDFLDGRPSWLRTARA